MSDFKLLLKRRHLLTQSDKAVKKDNNVTPTVVQKEYDYGEGDGDNDGGHGDHMSIDDICENFSHDDDRDNADHDDGDFNNNVSDITHTHPGTVSVSHQDSHGEGTCEVVIGSRLDEESQVISQLDDSNNYATSVNKVKVKKQPEKKDLIFSAGTIRSRYREVRKKEESRLQKKHDRTMEKHSTALLRESLHGQQAAQQQQVSGPGSLGIKSRKKSGESAGGGKNKPIASTMKKKNNNTRIGIGASSRINQRDNKKDTNNRGQLQKSQLTNGAVSEDIGPRLSMESESSLWQTSSMSLQQSQSALSSVLCKETAQDSIEELMQKYYEYEDLQEQDIMEEEADDVNGSVERVPGGQEREREVEDEDEEKEVELETVILTESVPFVDYPVNLCVIDGLVYSKFCIDAIYKGEIILIAKRALQQRQYLLLRSPVHYLTATSTEGAAHSAANSIYRVTSRDSCSDADRLRECRQILKSIFMSCVAFSGDPLPPDITERTTIQKEVTRPVSSNAMNMNSSSREEQILNGKSISEFVELEMLIPPKSY